MLTGHILIRIFKMENSEILLHDYIQYLCLAVLFAKLI